MPIPTYAQSIIDTVRAAIALYRRPVGEIFDFQGNIAGMNAAPGVEGDHVIIYSQLTDGLNAVATDAKNYTDNRVGPLELAIANEANFSRQQEQALRNDLIAEIGDREDAITDEISARTAADNALYARVQNDLILAMQRTIYKQPVQAVIDVPLPGLSLTVGTPVTLADGGTYTPKVGDSVLLVAQGGNTSTGSPDNAPYVIGAGGTLTLREDFNAPDDRLTGSVFPQILTDASGDPYLGGAWRLVTPGPVNLPDGQRGNPTGTALSFAQDRAVIYNGDGATITKVGDGTFVVRYSTDLAVKDGGLGLSAAKEADLRDITKTTGLLPINRVDPQVATYAQLVALAQSIVFPKPVATYIAQGSTSNTWNLPHGLNTNDSYDPTDVWQFVVYDSANPGNPVNNLTFVGLDPADSSKVLIRSSYPFRGTVKILHFQAGSMTTPAADGSITDESGNSLIAA